jgi:hypothetical protein
MIKHFKDIPIGSRFSWMHCRGDGDKPNTKVSAFEYVMDHCPDKLEWECGYGEIPDYELQVNLIK